MKELRQPDQFVSFWTKVGAKLGEQKKAILAAVIGLMVVVSGVVAGQWFFDKRTADRSREFARITAIASAPLLPTTEGDAAKAAAPAPDEFPPRFKSDGERKQAALKEADAFLAQAGGSKLRDEALLLKASYLMDVGQPAEALKIYQQLGSSTGSDRFAFLVKEGLGHSYEASGNIDQAIEAFTALAAWGESKGGFYRDRALFEKARLLEKKGSAKDAQALYKEVVEKYPQSALRDEVNDRLAVLEESAAAPAVAPAAGAAPAVAAPGDANQAKKN